MPKVTSYGMGQYRYDKDYQYIQNYTISKDDDFAYLKTDYQDVYIKLPFITSGNTKTPLVQSGRTFYMRLTLPQNNQFDTTLKLKLCPSQTNNENVIDTDRYQYIKQLIIPRTTEEDDNYSTVILYDTPVSPQEEIKVQLWDKNHNYIDNNKQNPSIYNAGELYLVNINDQEKYLYCLQSTNDLTNLAEDSAYFKIMDDKKAISTLPQTWKMADTANSTVTFDFVFSPKYNLAEGYSYLLLEIDRTDGYHKTIQYIDTDKKTYYGTRLKKEDIEIELYFVPNLLEGGTANRSAIQSGTDTLTHIGVWGHPEQLLAINGEEIRIGQSGFYELDDFTINQLGVIVYDKEKDRFTIDYEYKIIS